MVEYSATDLVAAVKLGTYHQLYLFLDRFVHHHACDSLNCLVQIKPDILCHEYSSEECIPVTHILEPVNDRFALCYNAIQLFPKRVLPYESLFKLYQLR